MFQTVKKLKKADLKFVAEAEETRERIPQDYAIGTLKQFIK